MVGVGDVVMMVADPGAELGGDRVVVPGGVPHLARVLGLGHGWVLRRYVPACVRARDQGDSAAAEEVGAWLAAHPGERPALLFGLLGWAEATVRIVYGPEVSVVGGQVDVRARRPAGMGGLARSGGWGGPAAGGQSAVPAQDRGGRDEHPETPLGRQ